MNASQIYIAISVVVLAIIAILVVFTNKKRKEAKLSKLAGLAFVLVISGIFFGNNRLLGYSLMGAGVILAVIDIIMKLKNK